MKVVIFAGGFGTRLMEETEARPKPMVEIGGKPILWHILKMYEHYGYNEFIICLGYKATYIKEYFYNYYLHNSDVTIELANNKVEVHLSETESFKVTLIDTGLTTNTAGRLKQVQKYVKDETFMLTYGDGVGDINLTELLSFHKSHGRLATLTSVQVPGRFGNLEINNMGEVESFVEKPNGDGLWINGGFFVLESSIRKEILSKSDSFEADVLPRIVGKQQLSAFHHSGFWQPMDTLREKNLLSSYAEENTPPWLQV